MVVMKYKNGCQISEWYLFLPLDVRMEWVQPPPGEIKAEEPFSCTYSLIIEDEEFWDWAVEDSLAKPNIFSAQSIT